MVRLLTIFLLTLLSFTNLGAVPYDVVHSREIDGAEGFSNIDPLVDAMAQHAGFVYSDRANLRLVIDEFSRDTLVTIALSGAPEKSIHYYGTDDDSLYIYALITQMAQTPKIVLVTLFENDVSMKVVPTNCFTGFGYLESIVSQDIRLERDPGRLVTGVWFETSLSYADNIMGFGVSSETFSTTILYSTDLETELMRENSGGLRHGNLFGDENTEFFEFTNYAYGYDFTASDGDSARGELKLTTVVVRDSSGIRLLEQATPQGNTRSVFVGNFNPTDEFDEVIFCGKSENLDGILAEVTPHIACYSFADQAATQLWYLEDSVTNLVHMYADRSILIGVGDGEIVRFLDYRDGTVIDSMRLGQQLENIRFFETYTNPSTLNLVGRAGDTVFVYRFETTIYAPVMGQQDEAIPQTFTLLPNQPNPFNGETRLSFVSEINQYLTLKVYNILGQEVATLEEGVFPPGTFFAYWDGTDDAGIVQSSGVYFAKLHAYRASQIIKLIFLK